MQNKGFILLETVISIGFISVILLSSFIVVNSIMNKNSSLYSNQIERRTINSIYSKIANDMYKYNINSLSCTNDSCNIKYYTNNVNNITTKLLEIDENGLIYSTDRINNTSSIKFNSVSYKIEYNILILSITYNDTETMKIYSINYKGE
ncbi:MAG: hypothetical protein IJO32_06375 [Bacilli bacterium]|nr:hypothetical protein [Bacilli bacterium]